MALNYQKPHEVYGADNGQAVVLQNGVLYTKAGKRIPDEVNATELDRLHIPAELRSLAFPQPPQAEPEVEFDSLLSDLAPEESSEPFDEHPDSDEEVSVTTNYKGVKVVEKMSKSAAKGKTKHKIGR